MSELAVWVAFAGVILVALIKGVFALVLARYTHNREDQRELLKRAADSTAPPSSGPTDERPRARGAFRKTLLLTPLMIAFCVAGVAASIQVPHPDINYQILRVSGFVAGIALALAFAGIDLTLYFVTRHVEVTRLMAEAVRNQGLLFDDVLEVVTQLNVVAKSTSPEGPTPSASPAPPSRDT